ncbi:MotA/TolQ/ExbB proton channel family protein [Salinisphaera sp. LB1]|uniref:MotA/TolQ/ExbB proton channel family protein n=1 Tax=Salinisphaera sp. LB1 TaxID=2183911 RepID=UPI000D7DC6CC|nr:MotA/TolQ/ExbB proton channel family protein [Salinisphaera sp. LB1]AWN17885.1 MotA/TolQ/ExbB proton channel family protein [Salinisphaera sp. LB1]
MLSSNLTPFVVPAVLWCLIVLSVITWALLVIKLVQFGRAGALNKRFQKDFWSADSIEQGESVVDHSIGPMADIAKAGFAVITGRDIAPGNRDLAHQIDRGERLERALRQQIERERRSLEGGLAVLASFGSTAPFIGLFGTVWGIMGALVSIGQTGSTGLQAVAGPVGHALIATGMGIAVAVPAVLIYNFLVRRLKAGVHSMNDFAHDFYALCQQSGFQSGGAQITRQSDLKDAATVGQKTHATA